MTMPAPGAKPVGMPSSIGKGKVASLPGANAGNTTSNRIMKDNSGQHFRAERQSMRVNRAGSVGSHTAFHPSPSGSHLGGMGGNQRGGVRH
ncbi:hypothetical protein HU230_0020160 [Bradyrhizobium quebecense]|uniref:Uncharacterized protein n=1 Tax=Bradyrhizobium quebecense TaxID=2748629 RepID=A0A974ACF5_9BRAD|nr:hypothetical protein [Bradyrhizobium quebecense]UGA48212.1 hypothetical protein HU230_0020160 [Bradyrhizobium quebecense]